MNLRQLLTYKFFIPWVLVIVLMGVIAASIGARAIDLSFRRELSAALEGFTLSCSDPKMESIQKGQFGTLLVIGAGEIADTEIQALLPSPLIEHLKAPSGERNEIRSWSTASGIYALKSIDRGGGESAWAIAFAQRPQFDRYLRPLIGLTLMFLMTVGMVGYWLLRRTDRLLAGAADSLRALALAISSGGISGHVSEETAPLRPVGHRGVAEFDEIANGLYALQATQNEYLEQTKQRALAREMVYGEQEAAALLQRYLFEQVVEEIDFPRLSLSTLQVSSGVHPLAFLLDYDRQINSEGHPLLTIDLYEAEESGLEATYLLIASSSEQRDLLYPSLNLQFDPKDQLFTYQAHQLPPPLHYVHSERRCRVAEGSPVSFSKGDCLFCLNSSYYALQSDDSDISEWITRILNHFSDHPFEEILTMIKQELSQIARRSHSTCGIKMLCIRFQ